MQTCKRAKTCYPIRFWKGWDEGKDKWKPELSRDDEETSSNAERFGSKVCQLAATN